MAHDTVENELKKLRTLEAVHSGCAQKLQTAQDLATAYMNASKEVQKELDEFALKFQSLEKKMHEEAQKAITQHVMRNRIEMMLEYQRGEWTSWDVNKIVRIYNEAYPNDALPIYIPHGDEDKPKTAKEPGLYDN